MAHIGTCVHRESVRMHTTTVSTRDPVWSWVGEGARVGVVWRGSGRLPVLLPGALPAGSCPESDRGRHTHRHHSTTLGGGNTAPVFPTSIIIAHTLTVPITSHPRMSHGRSWVSSPSPLAPLPPCRVGDGFGAAASNQTCCQTRSEGAQGEPVVGRPPGGVKKHALRWVRHAHSQFENRSRSRGSPESCLSCVALPDVTTTKMVWLC